MADGVRPGPHRGSRTSGHGSSSGACDAVFPNSASAACGTTSALSTIARTRRRCGRLVQLLLVSQKQIPSGKASRALWTFERLLFGVRALVTLQVLQAGKGALAGLADMRARLVGLGWWEVARRRLGVYRDRRSFKKSLGLAFGKRAKWRKIKDRNEVQPAYQLRHRWVLPQRQLEKMRESWT